MSKLYVGFNLGDGETITDYVIGKKIGNGIRTEFEDMKMPGVMEPGKAISIVFGYMKGELVFAK